MPKFFIYYFKHPGVPGFLFFFLSRPFACFVVKNPSAVADRIKSVRSLYKLSTKANSYTVNLTPLRGGLFLELRNTRKAIACMKDSLDA